MKSVWGSLGVIIGICVIILVDAGRYDWAIICAVVSILTFIKAAQFDPDKKLEDILENLDQDKRNGSPNFQTERLNFLIDRFQTYISKPFPNKHLNYTDPFFDDLYHVIAKIKAYDFHYGYEKENQLLDKIKAHNAAIDMPKSIQREQSVVQKAQNFQTESPSSSVDSFQKEQNFQKERLFPEKIKTHNAETDISKSIRCEGTIVPKEQNFQVEKINSSVEEQDSQKERLQCLIDNFYTYISKPFPNKHLNSTDPFFDDLYHVIAKIKAYDFHYGYEKENQLLDKIKAHNAAIDTPKSIQCEQSVVPQEQKLQTEQKNLDIDNYYQKGRLDFLIYSFHALMSKPFPNKHLNSTDSFFDEFYTAIAKIKGYDFKCGREKENQLLEKIKAHNASITYSESINTNVFNKQEAKINFSPSVNKKMSLDEFMDSIGENPAKPSVVKKDPKISDSLMINAKNTEKIGSIEKTEDSSAFSMSLIRKFRASIAEQLPDKYFSIYDSYFDSFKKQLKEIEKYCGNDSSKEESYRLVRSIEWHNEYFIKNHLNDPIFDKVCGYSLDEEQRRAILCDSKHNLVVAGAGTGKTLTICGKIQYLLENNLAKEDEILLMSYSSDSVDDISRKVAKVSANMKAKTFHSLGNEILTKHYGEKKAVEDQILSHIKAFLEERISSDNKFVQKIFKYFSCYIRSITFDFEKKEINKEEQDWTFKKPYRTLKEALKNLNKDPQNNVTAKKEYVRSVQELVIANFLFVNGIEYEYEKPYEINTATLDRRRYCPDFFLPDYGIYIEHYGIDKDGRARQYSYNEEQNYLAGIDWKRKTHRGNNTVCIETYSYEFSNGKIFTNLKKKLEEQEVEFKPLTSKQIKETVLDLYEERDFSKFMDVLATFLGLYKSKFRDNTKFDSFVYGTGYERKRATIFLEIAKEIYDYYISQLKENDKIDFDDMILQSTDFLDLPEFQNKYCYKYILVDEFQDISESRFKFLKKLVEHGNSKLMVVGDDWQSIYRFNGSDINIFVDFNKTTFPDATVNYITTTHRNSAELQDIAGKFIMKNPLQFKKQIKSDKHQQDPVRIITYKGYDNSSVALEQALREISGINSSAEILILGRTNNDINKKFQSETNRAFPNFKISYKTIHGSKGLESDFVILINAGNIPNKMIDDPIINRLLATPEGFMFAEERRLFYVTLTRTKSIVYILMQEEKPSVFVGEIKPDCCEMHFGE